MLSSVEISRFKNIEKLVLPLSRVNVLVGPNNSGKSSVLHAIQFAVSIAQTSALEGDKQTLNPERLVYAPLRDVFSLGHGGHLGQPWGKAISVNFEVAQEDGRVLCGVKVIRGKNRNLSVRIVDGFEASSLAALAPPFSMYVPGLAGLRASEQYVSPAVLRRAATRGDANSVFRNVLLSLSEQDEKWTTFTNDLAEIFPDHQVQVRFDPGRDELISARVQGPRGDLPIDAAGTGFLQTVQILAYAAFYGPRLLLLDEPDSHIHPDRQRLLMSLLAQRAESNDFQVLVATHSRHLLDELDGRARFHWMSGGERVDEEEFDRVRALIDLGALDRWDRLKEGQIEGIVLTEDETAGDGHPKNDRSAIRTLLRANGVDLSSTQVWSYKGCTNIHTAAVLASFIRAHAPAVKILVHRDRDYETDAEIDKLTDRLAGIDVVAFITEGTDAESHLANAGHVHELYPQISEARAQKLIDACLEEVKEASLQRFSLGVDLRNRYEKDKPTSRTVSQQCESDYDGNRPRYSYGKRALGLFTAKVQTEIGANPDLFQPSSRIPSDVLVQFAESLDAETSSPSPGTPVADMQTVAEPAEVAQSGTE